MRVLLISPYFPPQNAVASVRVHSFARALVEAGHEVTVLTVAKRDDQRGLHLPVEGMEVIEIDYAVPRVLERLRGQWKQEPRQGSKRSSSGLSSVASRAFSILRGLRARRGVYSSVRMPDVTDYWVKPARDWCRRAVSSPPGSPTDPGVQGRPARVPGPSRPGGSPTPGGRGEQQSSWDLVISSSGPYTAHLVAMALKREGLAARWIADFRDLWVNNHVFPGLFPFTLRERRLEKKVLRSADVVTTVSEGAKATLRRNMRPAHVGPGPACEHSTFKGGPRPPCASADGGHCPADGPAIEVIYNGYDETAFESLAPERILPNDGSVRLVYTGALYPPKQDPSGLLEALFQLIVKHPEIAERLCIDVAGVSCDEWDDLAHSAGVIEWIEPHGLVSRDEALRMQRDASALLLVDWPDPAEGVLTSKLFEYLQARAPILVIGGAQDSPMAAIVKRAGRGIHLGADVERICQVLIDLAQDPAKLRRSRDDEFIATLSRQRQAQRFVGLAEKLSSEARPG